jgi:hypothetical protein
MANIRKSFNLRNGVQVDNDNFIVNANGLVGIGTSTPSEILDVRGGNIKCDSTIISNFLNITGVGTATNLRATVINSGITSITSGIISATSGVVTYYGDGGNLLNLPTSQWLDVNAGLGFTSIYAQGFVGISTNDPRFALQVGGTYTNILSAPSGLISGVGINSTGSIVATGDITAGTFTGNGSAITNINADNISSGTLSNSRLPSSINITSNVTAGTFTGNGSAITNINADNISSGTLSNSRLPSSIDISSLNIQNLNVGTSGTIASLNSSFIGIGTLSGTESIKIFKSTGTSSIRLTSEDDRSFIVFGRNSNNLSKNGVIRYGNNDNLYAGTLPESLDILNYGIGNINYYNNVGSASSANFNWIKGYNNFLMTLTQEGKLGIGKTNPSTNLDVVGTSSITSDLYVGQNLTVQNNLSINSGTFNSNTILGTKIGVATNLISSSYDFQIGGDPISVGGGLGIKGANVYIREDIKQLRNINATGIVTASTFIGAFDGNGSLITNINASNIASGTISISRLPNPITNNINSGVVTATTFSGSGSAITNINASNITSGIIPEARFPDAISITGAFSSDSINSNDITSNTTITASDVDVIGTLKVQECRIVSGSGSFLASAGQTVIDNFVISSSNYKAIEYTIYLSNSTNIQVQKLLATQNGTNAYSTEFGLRFNPNKIGTASVTVTSGNFELEISPEAGITGTISYKIIRQSLT